MIAKVRTFFTEVRQELDKVVWPSRHELIGSTIVVIITTFLLAAFIAVADFVLSNLMRWLIGS